MKVLLTPMPVDVDAETEDEKYIAELRASFPQVTFQHVNTTDEKIREIKDADVYCGWPTREVFVAGERLRWLHNPGTGIDPITGIPELIDSDVVLTNCRGPHAAPMADHVIGMMLTLAHRLHEQWDDQRAHYWDTVKYSRRQVEIGGRTMGILALGGIGMAVAQRAQGFGMKVYAVDKNPEKVRQESDGPLPTQGGDVWGLDRLDDMLRIADWFVITAPLTAESRGMVDRRRVGVLKQGAYVVAISRGGIIDESALIEALQSGRLAGAGLDVMEQEPLPDDSPLWDMDNVILSPHASALTPEMFDGRRAIFTENLRRFLANEPFLYVCDKEAGF